MLQDLFINAVILVAFVSLGNQFIFGTNEIHNSKPLKIVFGLYNGVLGCILMLYSVTVSPSIILDLRNIPIIIASILGGFTSSIIAALIIGLFRITYFGAEASTIAALIIAVLMGFGCPLIKAKVKSLNEKWLYTTFFCTILVSIVFALFIADIQLLVKLLAVYWLANFMIILILSRYVTHLVCINDQYRKYKSESSIDYLTGLNNVRQFDTAFNNISSKAIERGEFLSLLFIDIDFFKQVNDTYGHTEGDLVLKQLGDFLLKTCRSFDIVSRNGGEEFSVILIDCPSEQATTIAERIRLAVENHNFILSNNTVVPITVSIGVATYPNTAKDINILMQQADKALYEAKQTGRNKVIFHALII